MIRSPDSTSLVSLCEQLRELSGSLKGTNSWPEKQLKLCGQQGVFRWFLPIEAGGFGWSNQEIAVGYLRLAASCMTTTFVLTQRVAACRRIAGSENSQLKNKLLPDLASGASFATVGISHLTTSRRHLSRPVLKAEPTENGMFIDGFSPWVTGGNRANHIVMGATLPDDRQVLFVVSGNGPGVTAKQGFDLVGLSASQTGAVHCDNVFVHQDQLLYGPVANIMSTGTGGTTGGLQTSTLAIGLATAAVDFIREQALMRSELASHLESLDRQLTQLTDRLIQMAGGAEVCTNEQLRKEANSLVLRATQAALVAAKGAGYVSGHPVGRWCQEALFFLVWSCPQSVLEANLCELAGIES